MTVNDELWTARFAKNTALTGSLISQVNYFQIRIKRYLIEVLQKDVCKLYLVTLPSLQLRTGKSYYCLNSNFLITIKCHLIEVYQAIVYWVYFGLALSGVLLEQEVLFLQFIAPKSGFSAM